MKRALPSVLSVLLVAACGSGEPGRVESSSEPAEVVVSAVETAPATLSFPAEVVAEEEVELATRASGIVRAVRVDAGSRVRAGQVLVELEGGDVRAGVSAARAGVTQASRSRDRIAALAQDGAATPQELDDADARLAQAEAELARARTQTAYVSLAAPFGGIVTARHVDPGDLVVPGQPALTLVSLGGVEARADLPGERAGLVSEGDPVTIALSDGTRLPARVARVVPALAAGSRRFRVEAALEGSPASAGVVPGSFARLEIEGGAETTLWIPVDAIVRRGQLTGVYVVADDTLRLRWVRLGRTRDPAVEVLAGLPRDGLLVRRPGPGLADGQPARVASSEPWRLAPPDGARTDDR